MAKKEVLHGPETVCYSGGPGVPYYQPWLQCLCGWHTEREPDWETIGALFDEHLADVERQAALPKKSRPRGRKKS